MPIRSESIHQLIETLMPGTRVQRIVPLGADHDAGGEPTEKARATASPCA